MSNQMNETEKSFSDTLLSLKIQSSQIKQLGSMGPGRPRVNFFVVCIKARKYFRGKGYWWVQWGPPFNQQDRDDHWQPITSFYHKDKNGNEIWNDLFLEFENIYPDSVNRDYRDPGIDYCLLDKDFFESLNDDESEMSDGTE